VKPTVTRSVPVALAWMILIIGVSVQDAAGQDDVDTGSEPATLSVWNRPIVTLRATVGGNEPAQRVQNARRRLGDLSEQELALPVTREAAHLAGNEGFAVTIGGRALFGVVEGDVDAESGLTVTQLAERAEARLREVIAARAEQRRTPVLMRGIGLTLLAVTVLGVAIALISVGRARAARKFEFLWRGWQVQFAGIDIVPTLATVERVTLRVISWSLILACVYLAVVFVLQQFPYTAPLGWQLGAYLRRQIAATGAGIVKAMPALIMMIAVLLITRTISVWVSRVLAEVERGVRTVGWLAQDQARATRRIAVSIVWLLGIASAYPLLPWSNSAVFQGMSVVLGLALSLASTGLVNQWISGLVILYSRSFRIGDFIVVGDVEGFVTEMGPLAVKLRTMRREEITLPNAVAVSDRLANLTRLASEGGALLSTSIAIGYDGPLQRV
jgi:small-conductance mechanosensitive channel